MSANTETSAEKNSPSTSLSMLARSTPSTSTLTVPSGSLSSCRMVATVPTRYKSSALGSSTSACFWATNRMRLSAFMARSSATMDFSRPTNSGITMCGYTTTSRSGSTGMPLSEGAASKDSATGSSLTRLALWLWHVRQFRRRVHAAAQEDFQALALKMVRPRGTPRFLDRNHQTSLLGPVDDIRFVVAFDHLFIDHDLLHISQ